MTGFRSANNMGIYSGYIMKLNILPSTGSFYHGIIDSVSPAIDFMYHQVLLNPIFMGLLLVFVILSLFLYND